MIEVSIQRVINTLAAGRCYACGWPLGSCAPFNCAMRYKDDTQHLAEREGWHARAEEMNKVLGWAVGQSTETLPTEAREKTVPELQAEIGRLTMELQFRVLGDPMGVVCTPSPQREKP